ncbi:MaoC/PaaZ C-terminal domain-containing protein [Haloparvum sp. PAK95]|uniref:MaoC/PaaZ C-terminal domain-containing protein n=1 Tax=Haloparvum sp. PAK95 TaxID=3418962 RepID=UPI003D2EEC43
MSRDFADLEVGHTVTTPTRTITEADVTNFAGVSGDFNPLHTSKAAGRDSAFGERVAHGALIFSLMTGLLRRVRDERAAVVAFYGVDELRFTGPTTIGETVHVESELVEKEPRDHPTANGMVRYETEVLKENGEVVLTCELLSLVK